MFELKVGKLYKWKGPRRHRNRWVTINKFIPFPKALAMEHCYVDIPKETVLLCLEGITEKVFGRTEMLMARFLVVDKPFYIVLYRENIHRSLGLPQEVADDYLRKHFEPLEKL